MNRLYEKSLATASFCMACILAVFSMVISDDHDIASGVLMGMAQFLILTASILHIDYKLLHYGSSNTEGSEKQQPA